ncbi:MAG: hypothetical protein LUQ04_08200 [Methanoregula sp.]|nr:hypothetical protein [Methanoregula sp.]
MFALACETVSRRVSRLPFLRSDVMVTGELLGVAMESLNAEFKKKLALYTPSNSAIKTENGLDSRIEERLRISGKKVVPVITEVLCSAGIAETTEITNLLSHQTRTGIRLLPPWTWHTASGKVPAMRYEGSVNGDESSLASMMSMCAVCRTGILNRIFGKQLFGIPRTEFYLECTYCGAKFIPVGTQFRLVSIATFRDPLWKKHLDYTFPAEMWSAIARGTIGFRKTIKATAGKTTLSASGKSSDGNLTQLKDGSLAVPCGEKTLYFKPVKLDFIGGMRQDFFARAQKPLQEILKNPAYSHLIPLVNAKYSNYVLMKSGLFLRQLKERHDPFYLEFLNNYGDEKYGTFRLDESDDGDKKGVLVIVVNRSIYYAVDCQVSFRITINNALGRISPEDCFLGGDSNRCRINALISNNRNDAGICIHRCEKEDERVLITEQLKGIISK